MREAGPRSPLSRTRPPGADTAALAVAAAYARVPRVGPRDLRAGHALVSLLGRLGEPGARELVRLREECATTIRSERSSAPSTTSSAKAEPRWGELDDAFAGLELDSHLTAAMPVGPYEALIQVADDLRRVRTLWLKRLRQSLARPPVARARLP